MSHTIGTCSICGGPVQEPDIWCGSDPPTPTCSSCGATKRNPYGPRKRGMNMELTDYEARIINDFIGQHWTRFLSFAEQHGICEEEAEDLANKLEKIAFQ